MFAIYSTYGLLLDHVADPEVAANWNQFHFAMFEGSNRVMDNPSELERLCGTIADQGIVIDLRRTQGDWQCCLYENGSRLYSTPMGRGATAVEAVNVAIKQRKSLLEMGVGEAELCVGKGR